MSRTFAYCCLSTLDQTTDNQIREITVAGFAVEQRRVVCDIISGSTPAMERKGFKRLLAKLDWGDVLIVPEFDRLGPQRNGCACDGREAGR